MSFPAPVTGLVVKYDFVWSREHRGGRDASKDRPVCVALAVPRGARTIVAYFPITHSPPTRGTAAIEIPDDEKRRVGLDHLPSWVVVTEMNEDW